MSNSCALEFLTMSRIAPFPPPDRFPGQDLASVPTTSHGDTPDNVAVHDKLRNEVKDLKNQVNKLVEDNKKLTEKVDKLTEKVDKLTEENKKLMATLKTWETWYMDNGVEKLMEENKKLAKESSN